MKSHSDEYEMVSWIEGSFDVAPDQLSVIKEIEKAGYGIYFDSAVKDYLSPKQVQLISNNRFLPGIHNNSWLPGEPNWKIQTSSYGTLETHEIDEIILGFETAKKVIKLLQSLELMR